MAAGDDRAKQLEEEVRRLETFLDAIVENIPDMIFVKRASDHMFVRFNRAGEELLGWKRSELLGKTDHDFYPKEQADFFHEKDRETLANKKLVDVPEEPIQTKFRGQRWLHTKKVPVLDEKGEAVFLLGISEDITARKEAEEKVHALERELASVVLHAADAIVTWRLDGTIASWNPAAERIYGVSAGEAVGRAIGTIVPEGARAAFRALQEKVIAGDKSRLDEVVRLRGDGGEVELIESVFVIRDPAGKPSRLASIARDVTELARLRRATEILSAAGGAAAGDAPESEAMRELLSAADTVAQDARATVLLLGETGVGKGWLARRIHQRSPRAGRPFFEVNCASLGKELLESELFGHERGAFTGAAAQKRGLVEVAEGGTLFLDEVGELPQPVQAQLLTFLDAKTFRRVGGTRVMKSDVRILAATNADLKAESEAGRFRKDLYYRLSVFPLTVPPLRRRREDLPSLARALAAGLAQSGGGRPRALSREVLAALARHDWPGNVRELRNALERALILARGGAIEVRHLPPEIRDGKREVADGKAATLEEIERAHIRRVLADADDNRTRAAEVLGISRSTLKRKLAEMGLRDEE